MAHVANRRSTGIPGFDEMMSGGFPVPSTILLAGDPGTGKTTLAVQSLFSGARKGESSVYITAISEPQWVVQRFLSEFSFFDASFVEREQVRFMDISTVLEKQPALLLDTIKEIVEEVSPKRLVIDPITPIKEVLEQQGRTRRFLHELIAYLKALDCVTVITSEFSYQDIGRNLESYMVDGVIMLSYPEEEKIRRKYIEVLKMRGTKHVTGRQLIDITSDGLAVQAGLR